MHIIFLDELLAYFAYAMVWKKVLNIDDVIERLKEAYKGIFVGYPRKLREVKSKEELELILKVGIEKVNMKQLLAISTNMINIIIRITASKLLSEKEIEIVS